MYKINIKGLTIAYTGLLCVTLVGFPLTSLIDKNVLELNQKRLIQAHELLKPNGVILLGKSDFVMGDDINDALNDLTLRTLPDFEEIFSTEKQGLYLIETSYTDDHKNYFRLQVEVLGVKQGSYYARVVKGLPYSPFKLYEEIVVDKADVLSWAILTNEGVYGDHRNHFLHFLNGSPVIIGQFLNHREEIRRIAEQAVVQRMKYADLDGKSRPIKQ